jgi:hypothetical protein
MVYSTKLHQLLQFLIENQRFNKLIQTEEIKRHLLSSKSGSDQAKRLLIEAYGSNSLGKLDDSMRFMQVAEKIMSRCGSFKDFCNQLGLDTEYNIRDITKTLISEFKKEHGSGFGYKKSSLFMRNLALIKRNSNLRKSFQWRDIETLQDNFSYIPVDAVIIEIFKHLRTNQIVKIKIIDFENVNKFLSEFHLTDHRNDFLIWDDLWFWGFISQKVTKNGRIHMWNEAKYWTIYHAPKDSRSIKKIKGKVEEFLHIIGKQ